MPHVADRQTWRWPFLATFLILAVAGLRLAYLLFDCPLDLAPDEAHYWDWSRHLDWSYYSKGPLVAWLIRASTSLFGDSMPAVRLPAVLCGSLLLASLYVLSVQIFGRQRLGVGVVALALTLPPIAAGSTLVTIDAPYTCCWGWALVLGWRASVRPSWWAWPACGAVVGLGILAKYTMILWLPSIALYLAASPRRRHLLIRPGFWSAAAIAALACTPILTWNLQHDWIGFRHVLGQSALQKTEVVRWAGPLGYIGVQFGLLLGFWFFAWVAAMIGHRPGRERRDGPLYLWWMSAPMFLFFLLFSLKTPGQPNWPAAAYLSGLVLAAGWVADQLYSPWAAYRRLTIVCLATACGLGLALTVLVHQSGWIRPLLVRLSAPVSPDNPLPLRRLDPTCRLRGWRFLAAEVDRLRAELQNHGVEPVLAGVAWNLPGELAFYCAGQPTVYSLGPALGDRHSQYDLWRPNPVADAHRFCGATFLLVGEPSHDLRDFFDSVDESRTILYAEGGRAVARWTITVCRGFRGTKPSGVAGY